MVNGQIAEIFNRIQSLNIGEEIKLEDEVNGTFLDATKDWYKYHSSNPNGFFRTVLGLEKPIFVIKIKENHNDGYEREIHRTYFKKNGKVQSINYIN